MTVIAFFLIICFIASPGILKSTKTALDLGSKLRPPVEPYNLQDAENRSKLLGRYHEEISQPQTIWEQTLYPDHWFITPMFNNQIELVR